MTQSRKEQELALRIFFGGISGFYRNNDTLKTIIPQIAGAFGIKLKHLVSHNKSGPTDLTQEWRITHGALTDLEPFKNAVIQAVSSAPNLNGITLRNVDKAIPATI